MVKTTTAIVLGVILVGAVEIARGGNGPLFPFAGERDGLRNLVLYAWGTRAPGPGQLRIPVPVEGTAYEMIIATPGEPKAVPLAMNAD